MRLSKEEVIEAVDKLRQLGVTPLDFDGKPTQQPVVLAWMPAVSIYFQDPDGHSLEFISMLDEKPEADLDVLNWQDWEQRR
jgi:lactoylglutathione lyase